MGENGAKWCKVVKGDEHTVDCVGSFQFNMDAKNRVFIPSKYREYYKGGFYVCKGADKCLYVYTLDNWEVVSAKIKALPGTPQGRAFKRDFFKNADMADLDAQGRFIIKAELAQYAGLKKECVILGAGDRFEIWNPEDYEDDSYRTPTADEVGMDEIF